MQDEAVNIELMRRRGICVIIPTYNNAGTIVDVVRRSFLQCREVIVVCDGCTDGTPELLRRMETVPIILELERNRGKGAALKTGFDYAAAHGFAYAITLDGDGQHFPEDIPSLVRANVDNPGALIVGARKNLEDVSRSKGSSFANALSNFWFTVQTGCRLPDTQTGYRLYPLRRVCKVPFVTSRYEAELELMVFASWAGTKLMSEEVNVYYPSPQERVSHFRPGRDFARITVLNVVLCALSVVYGWPRKMLRGLLAFLRTFYSLAAFGFFALLIMTPTVALYMAIGRKTEHKRRNLHKTICRFSRFALLKHGIPGVKYTESIPEGEDFSRPAVMICNHQSHLDLLPMLALTEKLVILTNDWVWNDPLYSVIIRNAEFLPSSEGLDSLMPRLKSLTERGYSIAIYPEGTRSPDRKMGRFHKGAFHMAQTLGLDIIPCTLYGSGHVLRKHGRILRRWPMHMEVGRRFSQADMVQFGETSREQASGMREYCIGRYREIADMIDRNV